jgi:hypothetical protein
MATRVPKPSPELGVDVVLVYSLKSDSFAASAHVLPERVKMMADPALATVAPPPPSGPPPRLKEALSFGAPRIA